MSVLGTGLTYEVELEKDGVVYDRFVEHNIMPQQGVDFIAGLLQGNGTSPLSSWHIGLFETNYTPVSSVVAADLQAVVGESLAYDEAIRQPWNDVYDGVGFIGNNASRAEFTMNSSKNIYGAFIVSSSTKGGTSGVLLSIARFTSPRQVDPGTILRITAGITLTPTVN